MELDGTSAKALYRRAHAHISRADLELGEADLARAIELEPSNYQIKSGKNPIPQLSMLPLNRITIKELILDQVSRSD